VEALDLLVKRDQDRTIPTLAALLEAGDSLRSHVIRALGQMRAIEAAPNLESLYHHCARHEQVEIVRAMTRIGGPRVPEFLRARLGESAEIRRVAARGLASLADRTHLPLLLTLAGDADWHIRVEAARGLGRLHMVAECQTPLITLARDVEPAVATMAREALAQHRKVAPAA
jgi:HEAT repeat protein